MPALPTTAAFRKTMTVAEQAFYTGISGNLHPLYVDAEHARKATGGKMLVFELTVASLATTALAALGGPQRRIASISLSFPESVRIGDTIEARAELLDGAGDNLAASIRCVREDGTLVAEGRAELALVSGGES